MLSKPSPAQPGPASLIIITTTFKFLKNKLIISIFFFYSSFDLAVVYMACAWELALESRAARYTVQPGTYYVLRYFFLLLFFF